MNKDEKELLEEYRKMTPENRAIAKSNVYAIFAAQENTKRQYGLDREPPKQQAGKTA